MDENCLVLVLKPHNASKVERPVLLQQPPLGSLDITHFHSAKYLLELQ